MSDVQQPLVTIGIPTYNRASTSLPKVLAVALAQGYPNLEILVSDNGSTDDTATVMRAITDPRVRYVQQATNLGANGNFNYLVDEARGTFLLLLHDDDQVDPDFIERCIQALASRPEAKMVRTGARVATDGKITSVKRNDVVGRKPAEFFFDYFAGRTTIYFCSTLFHTQSLRDIGGLHSLHNVLEDCVAVTEFVNRFPRVDIVEPLATFHRHGDNRGMAEAIERWSEDSRDLLERMCDGSGAQAAEVRQAGLRFFTALNYNRLYRNGSRDPAKYLYVYRAFSRRLHPLAFFYDRWIGRRSARVVRRLRRTLASS